MDGSSPLTPGPGPGSFPRSTSSSGNSAHGSSSESARETLPNQVVYLQGRFQPRSEAKVDIEDRGFMFADGVYEVLRYDDGRALAIDFHIKRLTHSLKEVRISAPPELARFGAISDELIQRNGLSHASVYWQVTRGSAPRTHLPPPTLSPTVMAIAYKAHDIQTQAEPKQLAAWLQPDMRWSRCDIKSLMLLANVLAKANAHDQCGDEAILHRDGRITEGSSTSVLVIRNNTLMTHPANQWILPSITRSRVLELAREEGLNVVEQAVPVNEIAQSDEIMLAGTTTLLAAVTKLDGQPIGNGQTGPITRNLFEKLRQRILSGRLK